MKVGFVAILGRPNVGKSTLLNKILDYEVSITSEKPQTTRDQIKGIYNDNSSQIVFIDTPGIHKPQQVLGERLNEASYSSVKDADLVLFLTPIDEPIGPGDKFILEKMANVKNKTAVITKIDVSDPEVAKKRALELKEKYGFKDVLGTSVMMKQSIDSIIDYLKEVLPEGMPFYPQEEVTDKSMRFIAKEIIRESAINNVKHEVPHSIGVLVNEFKEEENLFRIDANIFVERESQKGILVGREGKMIKTIGTIAREKMEKSFGVRIVLNLKIKVKKKWTDDESQIKLMGY